MMLGGYIRRPSFGPGAKVRKPHAAMQWSEGCSSNTFKEAYKVARTIEHEDYVEYMMGEISASDDIGLMFGRGDYRDNGTDKFSTCKPSHLMITSGFHAILFLMLALFFDLYLLVSLTFTSASKNSSEMRLWWISGGAVATLLVLYLLLVGTLNFLYGLLFLIVIRFPFPLDQMFFQVDVLSIFHVYALGTGITIMVVHHVLVRICIILWSLYKVYKINATNDVDVTMCFAALGISRSDKQTCNEIQEIQYEGNR